MSHWNYRLGFKRHKIDIVDDITYQHSGKYDEELEFGVVECYYNDNGDVQFTTERFMTPYGETKEDLIENLEMMLKDVKDSEVLDLDKLWSELKDLSVDDFMGENDE